MYTIGSQNIYSTILVLKQKPDLNHRYINGETALFCAVRCNFYYGVKLLIEAGADLNLRNCEGKTACYLAWEEKNNDIMKLLEANGAKK